jgi:predicted RNA polymerase sigma factor
MAVDTHMADRLAQIITDFVPIPQYRRDLIEQLRSLKGSNASYDRTIEMVAQRLNIP